MRLSHQDPHTPARRHREGDYESNAYHPSGNGAFAPALEHGTESNHEEHDGENA
jgi:hypothetical protein